MDYGLVFVGVCAGLGAGVTGGGGVRGGGLLPPFFSEPSLMFCLAIVPTPLRFSLRKEIQLCLHQDRLLQSGSVLA